HRALQAAAVAGTGRRAAELAHRADGARQDQRRLHGRPAALLPARPERRRQPRRQGRARDSRRRERQARRPVGERPVVEGRQLRADLHGHVAVLDPARSARHADREDLPRQRADEEGLSAAIHAASSRKKNPTSAPDAVFTITCSRPPTRECRNHFSLRTPTISAREISTGAPITLRSTSRVSVSATTPTPFTRPYVAVAPRYDA